MTLKRDILASLGSTCYKWLKFKPTALDAHTLYLSVVGHLKQINRLQKLKKRFFVVQLEKLHLDNTKVMRNFVRYLKLILNLHLPNRLILEKSGGRSNKFEIFKWY